MFRVFSFLPCWVSQLAAGALFSLAALWQASPLEAQVARPPRPQPPPPLPLFDPQHFLERFLGAETEADQQSLQQVTISVAEERQWGDAAAGAFLADLKRQQVRAAARGRDVAYVQKLAALLHPLLRNGDRYPSLKIYVADAPQPDARSFPGGTLVFFRGLLENAGSEAALVGVIGHELSHLDRGHQLDRLRRIKLSQQSFGGGRAAFTTQSFSTAARTMMNLFARPFDPEDELTADRDAVQWALRAGYEPRELATLLLEIHRRYGEAPAVPTFLQSHPAPLQRREAVLKQAAESARAETGEKLYVGKENLRRRTTRDQRRWEE